MEAQLSQKWTFGNQIGGGSYARVVEATDENGVLHAAKFVRKQPGASREMLLTQLDGVRNVVPVVDSGELGDEYVLVMPRADRSLREHLSHASPLPQADALQILIDVATALADLESKIVHRDLKPENVLLLNGSWCVADFGISRYADASTETNETRKFSMTLAYAAPEQWLHEHATPATDIYAFGVMAFELLEGQRPFAGSAADLRAAHLHSDPPALSVGPVLASLVQECLFKAPEARPTAANLLAKLTKAKERANDSRWERLASVNHAAVRQRAADEAETARVNAEFERRVKLFEAAQASWSRITEQFHEVINDYLSAASLSGRNDGSWVVELNGAQLGLSAPRFQDPRRFEIPFDVIATASIPVVKPRDPLRRTAWSGRSHSLYFADVITEGEYGWFETAFIDTPGAVQHIGRGRDQEPFAMNDLGESALHEAFGPGIGVRQVAWQPTRVDPGDCEDFIQRWLDWFASAAEGQLMEPRSLPETQVAVNWRLA